MATIEDDIKEQLMTGEEILMVARQSRIKPGGSMLTPNSIYITNRRVLWRNPKLLGLQKNYVDVDYRDISNLRVKKGIFSSEIYLKSRFLSDEIMIPAIDKNDGAQIGSYIQKGMRGELPNQLISERKTSSQVEPVKTPEREDPMKQLEQLGKLKAAGVITEEEFLQKKIEILKKI